eukprot:53894-Chlamydomonas_euryale.AAC.2
MSRPRASPPHAPHTCHTTQPIRPGATCRAYADDLGGHQWRAHQVRHLQGEQLCAAGRALAQVRPGEGGCMFRLAGMWALGLWRWLGIGTAGNWDGDLLKLSMLGVDPTHPRLGGGEKVGQTVLFLLRGGGNGLVFCSWWHPQGLIAFSLARRPLAHPHLHTLIAPLGFSALRSFDPARRERFVERASAFLLDPRLTSEIRRIWVGYWTQADATLGGKIAAKLQGAGAL